MAFTLTELIIVIALVGILASMRLPALASAKEKARRMTCKDNMHQYGVALMLYSRDNGGKLPPNASGSALYTANFVREQINKYGNTNVMNCPNSLAWVAQTESGKPSLWLQGTLYLGGRNEAWCSGDAGSTWQSPRTMSDISKKPGTPLILVADYNAYTRFGADLWTVAPHCRTGPYAIQSVTWVWHKSPAMSPKEAGAEGGNQLQLDGSVYWKKMADMIPYTANGSPDKNTWLVW